MISKNNFNISKFSKEEVKNLAVLLLKKISNPENGLGKELFNAIIAVAPQATVEAVIVDNIENSTRVLVTPRDDSDCPKSCHLPGSFIRYGETFHKRLDSLIRSELKVGIKKFKDTGINYNILEKRNKRHIIGLYFLVELDSNPEVIHQWINYVPGNLVIQHGYFLKSYFNWKKGKPLWN